MAGHTETMDTTYADIEDGKRHDIAVEFITRRAIDCDGEHVHRLLVADQSGKQFTVLATPDSEALLGLKTGATHRISGLLGAAPCHHKRTTSGLSALTAGTVSTGTEVVDAAGAAVTQAASQPPSTEPFGIIDARATVCRVREGRSLVDDWTPMDDDRPVTPPDYVCESCGHHVDAYELRETAEVDHMLENRVMENASPAPASADMASRRRSDLPRAARKTWPTSGRTSRTGIRHSQRRRSATRGLFYDYHFRDGHADRIGRPVRTRYAASVSDHPISGKAERYLSVGLDSTLSVDEFERPRLDLVAVLDVSGSMDSPFDAYYYDEHGRKREAEDDAATKLDAATQSLCALTEQLHAEDRLGVVLYNHRAHVAKPLRDVGTTDMPAIRRHIREIAAGGSTNLADGFEAAVDMLVDGTPSPDVERRVVFMTDMMPNTGATGDEVNSRSCSRTRPQRASTRRSSAWGWTRTRSWRTSCRAFAERTTTSSTRPRSLSVGWARSSTTWSLRWSTT